MKLYAKSILNRLLATLGGRLGIYSLPSLKVKNTKRQFLSSPLLGPL